MLVSLWNATLASEGSFWQIKNWNMWFVMTLWMHLPIWVCPTPQQILHLIKHVSSPVHGNVFVICELGSPSTVPAVRVSVWWNIRNRGDYFGWYIWTSKNLIGISNLIQYFHRKAVTIEHLHLSEMKKRSTSFGINIWRMILAILLMTVFVLPVAFSVQVTLPASHKFISIADPEESCQQPGTHT